jgi:hypothetical protein
MSARSAGALLERLSVAGCDAHLVNATFDAELWMWDARRTDSWIFVSLPAEVSR